jgi:hypothetical protein
LPIWILIPVAKHPIHIGLRHRIDRERIARAVAKPLPRPVQICQFQIGAAALTAKVKVAQDVEGVLKFSETVAVYRTCVKGLSAEGAWVTATRLQTRTGLMAFNRNPRRVEALRAVLAEYETRLTNPEPEEFSTVPSYV